ncbi:phosphatidylserine decarboxylase [Nannocystis exedens]|uniref:phosphatidylserine decarboxylase n=1 Tax=Nannocystis exedens TaxID=54 RepID=A0A1I1TB45_9BACT|nr:archaetidylserine decarboxylase [Nannocystis exedens]PCC66671.1 phosphatidylserine decarboxylase [Nannocystis exedens]SFD55795.1 phosphatidylserine decarboxylase [Nannocystis exedens]
MSDREIPWRARLAAAVLDVSPDWGASAASKALGAAARARLPRPLSRAFVSAYVRFFGVDLEDVDPRSMEDGYDSFNAFFTRRLRPGARPVDARRDVLSAPCDGLLRGIAPVERDTAVVAKGHQYTLGELLADEALAESFLGGLATTIYLHPRDYHRVHTPCDGTAQRVVAVPGRLLPVTAAALERAPRLFALNERLIHVLDTPFGAIAVVMIAAFGVGHMSCAYRHIEPHPREIQRVDCDPPVRLRKGDELGVFHLGSTVVVLTQAGVRPLAPTDEPTAVRMGQPLLQRGDVA